MQKEDARSRLTPNERRREREREAGYICIWCEARVGRRHASVLALLTRERVKGREIRGQSYL